MGKRCEHIANRKERVANRLMKRYLTLLIFKEI